MAKKRKAKKTKKKTKKTKIKRKLTAKKSKPKKQVTPIASVPTTNVLGEAEPEGSAALVPSVGEQAA